MSEVARPSKTLSDLEAWIASDDGQKFSCTRQYPEPGYACDRNSKCVGCLMVSAALELRNKTNAHETSDLAYVTEQRDIAWGAIHTIKHGPPSWLSNDQVAAWAASEADKGLSPTSSETRACTCHPDDNPPRPCPGKYALSECRKAAAYREQVNALALECAESTRRSVDAIRASEKAAAAPEWDGTYVDDETGRSHKMVPWVEVACGHPVMHGTEWYGPCKQPEGHAGECDPPPSNGEGSQS